jgi:hypothetical protein
MSKRKSNDPPPRGDPANGTDLADYMILLKEDEDTSTESAGRHAFYQSGKERSAAFQHQLRGFLKSRGLDDQVAAIGPPTVFPIMAIRCTPAVAKQLKEAPGVEDVVRDTGNISLAAWKQP